MTVEQFCDVSVKVLKLKIVEENLRDAEEKWKKSLFHEQLSGQRPGDSAAEHV